MAARALKKYLPPAVGAVILLGVLYSLGPGEIWRSLTGASLPYVCLTLPLFVAASYLRIYKWVLMRDRMGGDIGFGDMNMIYFSSKFWGMVSPMRSGEVVPALARSGADAQQGKVLSIILYDRILETFQTLVVFAALFVLYYGVFFKAQAGFMLAGILLVLAVFTFLLLSREAGEKVMGWADASLALLGGRKMARALRLRLDGIRGEMEEFYGATRSYFTVGFSLLTLSLTFACWALDIAFWVVLFKAFHIDTALLVTVSAVMVYSMMAALAPIPNGLGVADLSFALVLSRFGYTGQVGGLIILSRILVTGFVYLGYAACKVSYGRART